MRKISDLVATFLRSACWDHQVHSKSDHRMYDCAAQRLLAQHPEIARDSLYTAVVCGEVAEVERILAHGADPKVKNKEGRTAADWAWKRGLLQVAQLLDRSLTH